MKLLKTAGIALLALTTAFGTAQARDGLDPSKDAGSHCTDKAPKKPAPAPGIPIS